jgi:hypothetical protein
LKLDLKKRFNSWQRLNGQGSKLSLLLAKLRAGKG